MSKTLVAYFSASGVTKKLAERLAGAIGADIYDIVPEQIYTNADLDWQNPRSRSSVEMRDKAFRPAVAGKVDNMDQYDTIFIGFPIWWYVAPSIINTFLEQYDFSSKTIVPFATSGMSGMGNTNAELRYSCEGASMKEGKRFNANARGNELKGWAEQYL